MKKLSAWIAIVFALTAGCSLISRNPVTSERFEVVPVSDTTRTITFLEPMVWLDAPGESATRGVRLLDGTYELEAEDEDYLYFRSPVPIELRVLESGDPVDGRDFPGGLGLAKASLASVAAVAYGAVSETEKMHVMKMGRDFLQLEGQVWTRNF